MSPSNEYSRPRARTVAAFAIGVGLAGATALLHAQESADNAAPGDNATMARESPAIGVDRAALATALAGVKRGWAEGDAESLRRHWMPMDGIEAENHEAVATRFARAARHPFFAWMLGGLDALPTTFDLPGNADVVRIGYAGVGGHTRGGRVGFAFARVGETWRVADADLAFTDPAFGRLNDSQAAWSDSEDERLALTDPVRQDIAGLCDAAVFARGDATDFRALVHAYLAALRDGAVYAANGLTEAYLSPATCRALAQRLGDESFAPAIAHVDAFPALRGVPAHVRELSCEYRLAGDADDPWFVRVRFVNARGEWLIAGLRAAANGHVVNLVDVQAARTGRRDGDGNSEDSGAGGRDDSHAGDGR